MTFNTLIVEKKDFIGNVTIDRAEQMNTFSSEMAVELNEALNEMDGDEDVRVCVIKGSGKAFCAGIDISEFSGKSHRQYLEWVSLMERIILTIAGMKKPVIASARGYAVANGAGLIAASDLAIVAEGTRIGATAINVGLFCMGPAVPLSRSLGRKRVLELILTGDMIDSGKALEWGLVNWVVPEADLDEKTAEIAGKLARKSPLALQMGKKAFYGMSDMEYSKAIDHSNEMFASLCITEDANEGVDAFLNRRDPVWKGR
jgi:enoyl-CoA hydratase/carnithine racemase